VADKLNVLKLSNIIISTSSSKFNKSHFAYHACPESEKKSSVTRGGIASSTARWKIFVGLVEETSPRESRGELLTLYRIRSLEKFQPTYLPFVRGTNLFPFPTAESLFTRESVFYLGSRYKQGLRLPDVPYFSARSSRNAFFTFSTGGRGRDDRYSRFRKTESVHIKRQKVKYNKKDKSNTIENAITIRVRCFK